MTPLAATDAGRGPVVSVVIPAYNERERIQSTLKSIATYLCEWGVSYELIVVDDGSTDGTPQFVRDLGYKYGLIKVIENVHNRGKGEAVARGMSEAQGHWILFSDADQSTPIEEFDKLRNALEGGADIAIGSRGMQESRLEVRQPWYRVFMGRTFNRFVRLMAVSGIHDTQCGFKAVCRDILPAILRRRRLQGFAFDVEFLFLARHLGMRIVEIPVVWRHDDASKVSLLRDATRMLRDLLLLRLRAMVGGYRFGDGIPRRVRRAPRLGPKGGAWPHVGDMTRIPTGNSGSCPQHGYLTPS